VTTPARPPPAASAGRLADVDPSCRSGVGPFCLGYELTQCEEEPDRFVLRIHWTSTDDHLQKFRPSEQFRRFFPPIRPFVDDIEEMQHYHVVEDLTTGPIAETSRST
jgi:Antibiotic biosynthesis monooxygenase